MKKITIIVFAIFFFIPIIKTNAMHDWKGDSLKVSLLTCSPGKDLYSMFGHTGIRIYNYSSGEDLVFNYGMFNYNSDNFIFRFVKGETDYELGAEDAINFLERYKAMNHTVEEQVLNLTQKEKIRLRDLLFENYRPENRVYRYNFLYDNCTSRARDVIEKVVFDCGGCIKYESKVTESTFRDILHEFTAPYPWVEFGIDMLLGAEVDRFPSRKERMFIPSLYKDEIKTAVIYKNCNEKQTKLQESTCNVYHTENNIGDDTGTCIFTPNIVFWSIFMFSFILSIIDIVHSQIRLWWWDMLLMLMQGVAGLIVAFLYFYSDHPAVGSNWLVIVFNPLPLVFMYWIVKSKRNLQKNWMSTANTTVLVAFTISMPFIPQSFNSAMIPLVLSLQVRALSGELVVRSLSKTRLIKN